MDNQQAMNGKNKTLTLASALSIAASSPWARGKDALKTYARAQRCVSFLGPETKVSSVSPVLLTKLSQGLLSEGLSPSTVNRHMAALRGVLTVCYEQGLCDAPPKWRSMREPPGRSYIPSREELERFISEARRCDWYQFAAFVRALAATGLRLSEALNGIAGPPSSPLCETVWIVLEDTKSGYPRMVPTSPIHARALEHGPGPGDFRARWYAIRDVAGLPKEFTPHSLRHYRASTLAAAGVPLPVIAKVLGHRDIKTTMRYTHVGDEQLLKTAGIQ